MPALQHVSFFTLTSMLLAGALLALAQDRFPSNPVQVVSGGAGSQNHILMSLVSQKLSESWGRLIAIENRTRAGGVQCDGLADLRIDPLSNRGVRQDRSRGHRDPCHVAKSAGLRQ